MDYPLTLPYGVLWKKYRPAILKLMIDAQTAPQEYKLFPHEVKSIVPNGKSTTFSLRTKQGKAISGLKDSIIARDLLATLNESKKAMELMETVTYDFTLKRDYTFQVAIVETV